MEGFTAVRVEVSLMDQRDEDLFLLLTICCQVADFIRNVFYPLNTRTL